MFRSFCFLFFLFVLSTASSFAQEYPAIQTDRPDQTECPFIVPLHYLQLENGILAEHINNENYGFSTPTILWRLGLNDRFELRMITEYNSFKDATTRVSGLSPITFGMKVKVCDEKGIIPATALIGHITTTNWGSKEFRTTYYAPSFRFTMQHTLSSRVSLSYNLGAEWNGESAEPIFLYTLTSGISLTDKLGMYIELYGYTPQFMPADHRCDGGFTYLITHHFMMDLSGGIGISPVSPKSYISLGGSYRFKAF